VIYPKLFLFLFAKVAIVDAVLPFLTYTMV